MSTQKQFVEKMVMDGLKDVEIVNRLVEKWPELTKASAFLMVQAGRAKQDRREKAQESRNRRDTRKLRESFGE